MELWLSVLTVTSVVLASAIWLIVRQIALIAARVPDSGARDSGVGPRVGENLYSLFEPDLKGYVSGGASIIIFVTEGCPACAKIFEALEVLPRHWKSVAFTLIYDSLPKNFSDGSKSKARVFEGGRLREACGINFVPFAIAADCGGLVRAKGLVNGIGHIESLLNEIVEVTKSH